MSLQLSTDGFYNWSGSAIIVYVEEPFTNGPGVSNVCHNLMTKKMGKTDFLVGRFIFIKLNDQSRKRSSFNIGDIFIAGQHMVRS